MNAPTPANLPTLPCLCSNFRRAARALSQAYDQALRPSGLRSTQFTILQTLSIAGEVTQQRLGVILAMDSTTLTRTLKIIAAHRWIAERPGDDRRERLLRLSPAGEAKLRRARPAWEKVQARLREKLGEESWKLLFEVTTKVAASATH